MLFSLLTLLVVTDPHVLAPSLHDDGVAFRRYCETAGGRDLAQSVELWNAFLDRALSESPQVVLVTGDLTNQGELASHELVAQGLRRLKDHGIQVLVIPGNHDLNNPWARSFVADEQRQAEALDSREFATLYGDFGYNQALSRDHDSLSYLAQLSPKRWILMLDSAVYDRNWIQGYPETSGVFTDKSLEWIEQCGKKAHDSGAELIAAVHHNITDHSPVIHDGYTIDNASELVPVLVAAGVRAVFSGHIHIQDIAAASTPAGPLYDVVTNALSVFPNHYGRITWSLTGRELRYRTLATVPETSALGVHAREAFVAGARRTFPEGIPALMNTLNLNYFSGHEELNCPLTSLPEFKILAARQDFLGTYARSLTHDLDDIDDNELDLR